MLPPKPIVRWTRANGLDFAYLEQGKGPLLLCLHGFPDTAWSFAPLLPMFASAGYRAVAPFMRGYAPTSLAADGDYRVTAHRNRYTLLASGPTANLVIWRSPASWICAGPPTSTSPVYSPACSMPTA